MRQSQLLIPTLKEAPAGAEVASHQLMLRAGLVRQVAAGLYTWLPLGLRVIRRIEAIIREEMDRSGAQEVLMPVVQPAELWQESGRWEKMGPELARLADRHERDFCLGPTHEEVITDLFRREVHSYRQLPCNFYQIQTKFRDEVRPRFGVMRAREFTMKDAYSFAADQASFDATYRDMHDCYSRILRRMQLDFRAVEADTGNIGGANSHEFHVLAASGEDTVAYASEGGYAANLERAVAAPPPPRPTPGETLREVATPGRTTIAEVAQFLEVPVGRCVKALAIRGEDGPILLILRGDHELNAIKAQKLSALSSRWNSLRRRTFALPPVPVPAPSAPLGQRFRSLSIVRRPPWPTSSAAPTATAITWSASTGAATCRWTKPRWATCATSPSATRRRTAKANCSSSRASK